MYVSFSPPSEKDSKKPKKEAPTVWTTSKQLDSVFDSVCHSQSEGESDLDQQIDSHSASKVTNMKDVHSKKSNVTSMSKSKLNNNNIITKLSEAHKNEVSSGAASSSSSKATKSISDKIATKNFIDDVVSRLTAKNNAAAN